MMSEHLIIMKYIPPFALTLFVVISICSLKHWQNKLIRGSNLISNLLFSMDKRLDDLEDKIKELKDQQ